MAAPGHDKQTARRQWAGLSIGLLVVTTLLYVIGGPPTSAPVPPLAEAVANGQTSADSADALGPSEAITEAISHYEHAIAELQAATASGTDLIEPATQAALLAETDVLDRAIADSRRAVSQDPDSEPARLGLFEALERKVAMLQATMALINDMQQTVQPSAGSVTDTQGRKSS